MNNKHYLGLSAVTVPLAGIAGHVSTIRPDYQITGSLPIDSEGELVGLLDKGKGKGVTVDFEDGKYQIYVWCQSSHKYDKCSDSSEVKMSLIRK